MKTVVGILQHNNIPDALPVIPTMDVVVFPNMIVPLLVLDEKIIIGVKQAHKENKPIFLLAARNSLQNKETVEAEDLYTTGTVANIMRIIEIPEGGIKILIQGVTRASTNEIFIQDDVLMAAITVAHLEDGNVQEMKAHINNIKELAEKLSSTNNIINPDFNAILSKMHDEDKIADFILAHLRLNVDEAQILLEQKTRSEFFELLHNYMYAHIELNSLQEKIRSNARESMNRAQKEYYLREQLRAIKDELGENDLEEIEEMREKLQKLVLAENVEKEVARQIDRLENTAPESLEATVTRNYLEWIFALPWNTQTEDNLDLTHARKVLDDEHFGLEKVKDRILDFIAIKHLKQNGQTPILCFVGPPGTGKTSLGKSIARSLNREYARISLGGVKDESEIRGHRRTYVGSMPGRFIQAMRKAGTKNPLIVIDELDKIGSDFRGDPSAAMLEVLDPQQNESFYDNYLGIPFDLSKAMFIATANRLDTISGPLRDRMEIIELSGYAIEEKVKICKKFLIKKAIDDTGLKEGQINLDDKTITSLIENYTLESGIRQLDRIVHQLCSKEARSIVETKKEVTFTTKNLENYLGPKKYLQEDHDTQNRVGISNGLAWTSCGGQVLKIEAVLIPGKGKLMLTGQLGDTMKESAQAALSYARAHADRFKISQEQFSKFDLHIHVPAGAVPKDGPSAGITMLISILSVLTNKPINAQYAMTGELNLRGDIMPIGGVKEKILAARRNNISHVFLPKQNETDLLECKDSIDGIEVILVKHADEVIDRVLMAS